MIILASFLLIVALHQHSNRGTKQAIQNLLLKRGNRHQCGLRGVLQPRLRRRRRRCLHRPLRPLPPSATPPSSPSAATATEEVTSLLFGMRLTPLGRGSPGPTSARTRGDPTEVCCVDCSSFVQLARNFLKTLSRYSVGRIYAPWFYSNN